MKKMIFAYLRRHKRMIMLSIFFLYLGSGITISLLQVDCVEAKSDSKALRTKPMNLFKYVEYAVLTLSAPNNVETRDIIRATWGTFALNILTRKGKQFYKWDHTWTKESLEKRPIINFFVIGTRNLPKDKLNTLVIENEKHGDLLLLDNLADAYNNLSQKVLYALKWFSENLANLKYIIKCDDDSFVRIDLIVKELDAYAPAMNNPEAKDFISFKKEQPAYKGLYWGYFNGKARVFLSGKWEEKDWFLCDNYLPYAQGGGYVVSRSIADYVAKNYDILSLYNSEDVSMGVWTAALGGINRVHDIRFDTEWESRGCASYMLVRHKQTAADMRQMYKTLIDSNGKTLCKEEVTKRKHFIYDWNVLPGMCCKGTYQRY